jgi:hypothetical protein
MGEWKQWENTRWAEYETDGPYLSIKSVFFLGEGERESVCVCVCVCVRERERE